MPTIASQYNKTFRHCLKALRVSSTEGFVKHQGDRRTVFRVYCKRNANRLQRAIRITVEDNGKGISAETRDQMFDMFSSTKAGGRGLGLSVVSEVVAAHEGRIKVESRPGQTKFSVFLPMKRENIQ